MASKVHQMGWNKKDEDETDVTVHFTYAPGSAATGHFGPPENYDPGSGAEVEVVRVVTCHGNEETTLTDAEAAAFRLWVEENPDRAVPDDEPEWERDDDERPRFGR